MSIALLILFSPYLPYSPISSHVVGRHVLVLAVSLTLFPPIMLLMVRCAAMCALCSGDLTLSVLRENNKRSSGRNLIAGWLSSFALDWFWWRCLAVEGPICLKSDHIAPAFLWHSVVLPVTEYLLLFFFFSLSPQLTFSPFTSGLSLHTQHIWGGGGFIHLSRTFPPEPRLHCPQHFPWRSAPGAPGAYACPTSLPHFVPRCQPAPPRPHPRHLKSLQQTHLQVYTQVRRDNRLQDKHARVEQWLCFFNVCRGELLNLFCRFHFWQNGIFK